MSLVRCIHCEGTGIEPPETSLNSFSRIYDEHGNERNPPDCYLCHGKKRITEALKEEVIRVAEHKELPAGRRLVYILPEYCDHDFFTGWHLYERERADGSRNVDGEWGCGLSLTRVRQLCIQIGHVDMPELDRKPGEAWNGDAITLQARFVDEFARRFPFGLRAWKDRWEYTSAPFGFDTHPDRQIILNELRLYFAWRNGKQYALLATDVDDAQNRIAGAVSVSTKEVA